jgi:hypothetical protein
VNLCIGSAKKRCKKKGKNKARDAVQKVFWIKKGNDSKEKKGIGTYNK